MSTDRKKSVFLPVVLLLLCLFARWILVAGLGDFPGDYDYASRLVAGYRQGRDFFMAYYTAVSWYTTALWLKLVGGHFIGTSLAVWVWWLLNVLAAGWVLCELKASRDEQALGAAAVALLTAPPNTNFVVMNFFASALSAAAVALFLVFFRTSTGWSGVAAGVLAGVGAASKPTAGVGVYGAMFVGLGVAWLWHLGSVRRMLFGVSCLTAGFMLGLGIPMGILGYFGGYGELFREAFLSAGATKGGPVDWFLRTFPRISLVIRSPNRYLIEVFLILPVVAVLAVVFWRTWRQRCRASDCAQTGGEKRILPLLWLLFGVVLLLSLWSLIPAKFPHELVRLARDVGMISLPEFNNHLLYVVIYMALGTYLIICGWQYWRPIRTGMFPAGLPSGAPVVICIVAFLALMAIAAGGRYGSVYVASVFIPALIVMTQMGRNAGVQRWLVAALIIWTVSWHIAPTWRSTFSDLAPLPEDSICAGLYWPNGGAGVPGGYPQFYSSRTIEQLQANVGSRVQGKTLLWMITGLSDAFGGEIYRPGLVPFNPGHPLWNELRVARSMWENPPDVIITVGDNPSMWDNSPRSHRDSPFHSQTLRPWLEQHYDRIWVMRDNPMPFVLWQKRR